MNRLGHRSTFITASLVVVLLSTSLLSGCAQKSQTEEPLATSTSVVENTPIPAEPTPSPTPSPLPPTPTVEPTAEPVVSDQAQKTEGGLFLMAMQDGKYRHLFVYHPEYMSITRITSGEFDTDDPAISPDGSSIAYCSKQSGKWEVYLLNLLTAEIKQITRSDSYACAPTWSPDGLWLAYETVMNNKLAIMLHSTVDLEASPILLTDEVGNNFDPAWSASGRQIAFVTDRNGKLEIWQADLNAAEDRLSMLVSDDSANYFAPSWSLDGSSLVVNSINDRTTIERLNISSEDNETIDVGSGSIPVWASTNSAIAAILVTSNGHEFVTYRGDTTRVLYPALTLPDRVTALTWQPGPFVNNIESYLSSTELEAPTPIYPEEITAQVSNTTSGDLVYIEGLDTSVPYLSSAVSERFSIMRDELAQELGWDFLKILEYTTPTASSSSPPANDWAYTGRAMAVNLNPLDENWMKVSREDFNGRTYWRVWLKCMEQDGSCGTPLKALPYDLSTHYNDELTTTEIGEESGKIAKGYWLDFTAFALDHGWERFAADPNWRNYFPATNMNLFALTDGLTWQQAMRQINE